MQSRAPAAAQAAATRACALAVESGDRPREAAALRVLAEAAHHLGDVPGALCAVETALERLEEKPGDPERLREVLGESRAGGGGCLSKMKEKRTRRQAGRPC